MSLAREPQIKPKNVLNSTELPRSAQVKSRSHILSLLRALLSWCFLLQGDWLRLLDPWCFFPSSRSNCNSRSRTQLLLPWPLLWAPRASPGLRMEHIPPGPLQHPGNVLFGLQERFAVAAWAPVGRSPRPVPAGVTVLGYPSRRHKLLPAPDARLGTDP